MSNQASLVQADSPRFLQSTRISGTPTEIILKRKMQSQVLSRCLYVHSPAPGKLLVITWPYESVISSVAFRQVIKGTVVGLRGRPGTITVAIKIQKINAAESDKSEVWWKNLRQWSSWNHTLTSSDFWDMLWSRCTSQSHFWYLWNMFHLNESAVFCLSFPFDHPPRPRGTWKETCKVTDFGMAREVQQENIYER